MDGMDVLKLKIGDKVIVKENSKVSFTAKVVGLGYDWKGLPSHIHVKNTKGKIFSVHHTYCELPQGEK